MEPWMATAGEDEGKLVRGAQKGNLDAFNALILQYQTQVYNLAYQMLQDPASADDATQETFISAYHGLESSGGDRSGPGCCALRRMPAMMNCGGRSGGLPSR